MENVSDELGSPGAGDAEISANDGGTVTTKLTTTKTTTLFYPYYLCIVDYSIRMVLRRLDKDQNQIYPIFPGNRIHGIIYGEGGG